MGANVMDKLKEILFLKNIKGVGKAKIHKKYWGYLENGADIDELGKIIAYKETGLVVRDILIAREKSERLYQSIVNDFNIHVITAFDENYPMRLRAMGEKRPLILYIKGDLKVLSNPNIAVVGTRYPSEWSQQVEKRLVKKILELSNRTVVSGLAIGCDKIAHETTVLEGKKTVAVLPSGINIVTPASHEGLAKSILETGGCLVSEYEPNVKASRSYFIERDAIVAALSDITLVIECDVVSGTMRTVNAVSEYKRKLSCYYPINMKMGRYAGNEFMVKAKKAIKVRNADDLMKLLLTIEENGPTISQKEPQQLSFEEYLKNK